MALRCLPEERPPSHHVSLTPRPLRHAARTAIDRVDSVQRLVSTLVGRLSQSVRAVAFWVATVLPLSYLPLLASDVSAEQPFGFVALLCVNAAAFVVGHTHNETRNAER